MDNYQPIHIEVKDNQNQTLIDVRPKEGEQNIQIQAPTQQGPSFLNAVVSMVPFGLSFLFAEGRAEAAEQVLNTTTQAIQNSANHLLYFLANGIASPEQDAYSSPAYIRNLKADLVKGQSVITNDDIMLLPLYSPPTTPWPWVNQAVDVTNWFVESHLPFVQLPYLSGKISDQLRDYFMRRSLLDAQRPVVAVGYSGGFMPLVESLSRGSYKVTSLVALGAATLGLPSDLINALVGIVNLIETSSIAAIEALLQRFGVDGQRIATIVADVNQRYFEKAIEQAFDGIAKTNGELQSTVLEPSSLLPSPANRNVQQLVNVWGTQDVLYRYGIAGRRTNLSDVFTQNIEIVGSTHFDYMMRDPQPNESLADIRWNGTVAGFVTNLIRASNDLGKLDSFLKDPNNHAEFKTDRQVWVVTLPGFELRQ